MQNKFIINKDFNPWILRVVLKRNWYYPLLALFGCFLIAFIYLRYTKPIYESALTLQLDNTDQAKDLLDLENVNTKNDNLSSEVELLKSQLLFERAVKKLSLDVSLYSKGQILTEEKYLGSSFNVQPYSLKDSSLINLPINILKDGNGLKLEYLKNGSSKSYPFKPNKTFKTEDFEIVVKIPNTSLFMKELESNELYFTFNSISSLTNRLLGNLTVIPLDYEAKTIQISYKSYNANLSHDIVTAVTNAFFEFDNELKRKGSQNVLDFIDKQLDSLSGDLKNSKDSLMQFQRDSNLPDPDQASVNYSENIDKLQDQLFEIEEELSVLRLVNTKLKNDPNRLEIYRLIPEMLGRSFEVSLSNQIKELYSLLERREDLLFEVTEENSEVKAINNKIQLKIQSIRRSVSVIEERLSGNFKMLNGKIGNIEGKFYALPQQKMEFSRLKNIQELNEKYYTLLTEKKVQFSISNAGFTSTNRILSKAQVNGVPSSPNRRFTYSVFIFLGLVLGLFILFIKYIRFDEINDEDDLRKLLPPATSTIGIVPLVNFDSEYSQILVFDEPKSILSEAMRNIRSNLNFIDPQAKTIAVTSTISGEGKTFVVLNLGGILALSGKKVVIVDLDLRKPKIHHGFKQEIGKGVSSIIIGDATIEQCIRQTKNENLNFITAGPLPPNPSELLLSKSFYDMIDELKTKYDIVLFDNPPIGIVSDGVHLLSKVDIPIYIFKAQYSRRNFVQVIRELYDNNRIQKLNVILNGVKKSNSGLYGYGYGYGSGYYEDSKDSKKRKRKNK